MAETMEQYMSKTRANYGSGVARPKIENKDNFELKGQFLKELRTNTFSGSDHEDANEHIEKVLEIVDLFHIPNITIDQTAADAKIAIQEMAEYSQKWNNGTSKSKSTKTSDGLAAIQAQLNNLGREIKKMNEKFYAAKVGCEQCKGPHYTKDCPLKEEGKTLEEAYYMRNQGDDLMPNIEEDEVIKEFRTKVDELDDEIDDYPSYCDYDKKIHIDCAHNLKFSCMIGFEFTHANFFPLLYVNVMSIKFHNSVTKDKMVYKGNNVVGDLMNVPIFVRTFSVVTDFVVLENMDDYRDEGMGDVIFGKPFLRDVGIFTRRSERIITIHNGNDYVTYQMVQSHSRFKYHTNEQCNKIPPLLKVSDEYKMESRIHTKILRGSTKEY
nr:hypothetical protein [Tanacetum cinerariifolium]